jgi:hypothetical protein
MNNNEIVLKALDEVSSQIYEKTLVDTDIHEIMTKTQFFFFIEDCIRNNKSAYDTITTVKENDTVKITFNKNYTYFKVTKSITLNLIKNDKTITQQELLEKDSKIEQLEKQLNSHKNIELVFDVSKYTVWNRNSETINLSFINNQDIMWRQLHFFPNLTKLIINDTSRIMSTTDTKVIAQIYQLRKTYTLKFDDSEKTIKVDLPTVKELQIINKGSTLRNTLNDIDNMPNLETLILINYNTNPINIDSIKNIKSLKVVKLYNCKGIKNCEEIDKYCKENNIELEI